MSQEHKQKDMDTGGVLEHLRLRDQQRRDRLAGITPEHRVISPQEISEVRNIQGVLVDFLDRYGESSNFEHLCALERYLDSLSLWRFKFSTGEYDREGRFILDDTLDSLYYVTASGISLRLKRSALAHAERDGEGACNLESVVQPFADLVIFRRKGEEAAHLSYWETEPSIGFPVREEFTISFGDVLKDTSYRESFVSPLELYRDDKGLKDVGCDPRFRAGTHDGHDVNRIYFVR